MLRDNSNYLWAKLTKPLTAFFAHQRDSPFFEDRVAWIHYVRNRTDIWRMTRSFLLERDDSGLTMNLGYPDASSCASCAPSRRRHRTVISSSSSAYTQTATIMAFSTDFDFHQPSGTWSKSYFMNGLGIDPTHFEKVVQEIAAYFNDNPSLWTSSLKGKVTWSCIIRCGCLTTELEWPRSARPPPDNLFKRFGS